MRRRADVRSRAANYQGFGRGLYEEFRRILPFLLSTRQRENDISGRMTRAATLIITALVCSTAVAETHEHASDFKEW
jgi:hypothetical protein